MKKILEKYKNMPVQVRASLWFLVCSFMQKGISSITTPIFTRLLTTEEYGQYNVFNSWLSIITVFATLQLYSGVYSQGLIKFSEDRNIFSSSLQGLTILLVAAWTGIYLAFHNFWNNILGLTTVQMLAMFVMMWATAVFGFWASEQRVNYKYQILVIVTIIVSIAKPVVSIIFIKLAEDKVTARILGLTLVELISYTGFFIVQMKNGKVFYSKKYWLHALAFNLPLVPHYLSQTVLNSADRIMIKDMIGDSEAGIYSLAYSISQIMTLFNSALGQTLNPWEFQKIKEKKLEDISKITYPTMIIIAGVNIALIAFAPEIVMIFAPKSYYDAIYVIPPVTMSMLFTFSYDRFVKIAFYHEKTKLIAVATIVGAALNVLLNYIFIPVFGYYAAGYTTLVCYIIYTAFHYILMRYICKKNINGIYPYKTDILLSIYIAFMVLGFVYLLLYKYTLLRYSLTLVLMTITFINKEKIIIYVKQILNIRKKK